MARTIKVKEGKITDKVEENCFEWIKGCKSATLTVSEPSMVKKIKSIYKERAKEFKAYYENKDGSICVTVPRRWIKVNPGAKTDPEKPKKTMTEEQKKAFAERMAAVRAKKKAERED